jgi:hypothetical protein
VLSDRQSAVTEREHLIVDAFVHLADTLVDDYDVFDFLHYLTVKCVELGERTDQWPTFAPRALDVGFRSVHSVPLRPRHQIIAALNLMRCPVGRLSDIDSRLATALSDVSTIGLLQERAIREAKVNSTGLELALTSRVRIEQAKGVIAERSTIDIDDAFDLLRQHARRNGLRLTDVADAVVRGELAL